MAANMAATEPEWRPTNINWAPKDNDSDTDWAMVGKHAMSYAGHFSLNTSVPATEVKGQLLHGPIVAASVPTMVGKTQVRNYEVIERQEGVYLKVAVGSNGLDSEIWWIRVAKG